MKGKKSGSDDPIEVRCESPNHAAGVVRATWSYYVEAKRPNSNSAIVTTGEVCDVHRHDLPAKGAPYGRKGHIVTDVQLTRIR